MRLEILVGNDEPQIFPLSKPKIVLGTHETCDIVLSNDGISRKHLIVFTEGDQYYLVDQGSSNGSYVNNQRLIPGQKVEFTSFFPVRLGNDVILSLLSDEDSDSDIEVKPLNDFSKTDKPSQSSTRVINLKDLNSVKTEKLYTQKKQTQQKLRSKKLSEKSPVKKTKLILNWGKIIPSLIIIGAFILKFDGVQKVHTLLQSIGVIDEKTLINSQNSSKKAIVPKVTNKATIINVKNEPVIDKPQSRLISASDLTPAEKIEELKLDIKCTSEAEKYFCGKIPKLVEDSFGAYQRLSMVHIFMPGQGSYEKALNQVMKSPNVTTAPDTEIEKWMTTALFLNFIKYEIPTFTESESILFNDLNITFILNFKDSKGDSKISRYALKYSSLVKLKSTIEERHLDNIKNFGIEAVEFTKEFFQTY